MILFRKQLLAEFIFPFQILFPFFFFYLLTLLVCYPGNPFYLNLLAT